MKYLIIFISAIMLSACGVRVSSGELIRSQTFCSDKGGIEFIGQETFFGIIEPSNSVAVTCMNGNWKYVNRGGN